MTRPVNKVNRLLHEHWEPWARSVCFYGESDDSLVQKDDFRQRLKLIEKFSLAIPNEESLNAITRMGPIIEVGSGSGYWAFLIRCKCVDIIAVDDRSSPQKWTMDWFPSTIKCDALKYLEEHGGCSDRTLFMSWPTCGESILSAFKGDHFIIIGKSECRSKWELCNDPEWVLLDCIEIPVWPGMYNRMRIYMRRTCTN